MCWLASSRLVFFLGEFWTILNGSALVFMVLMLIIIGLLCGRNCPGYVLGGTQLGFYLVILTLLDTHVRGLVVRLLA